MSALHDPPAGESDTRSKLINPAIRVRDWTEEYILREDTPDTIEIIDGNPRCRSKDRVAQGNDLEKPLAKTAKPLKKSRGNG